MRPAAGRRHRWVFLKTRMAPSWTVSGRGGGGALGVLQLAPGVELSGAARGHKRRHDSARPTLGSNMQEHYVAR